jgi:hypothetical protein
VHDGPLPGLNLVRSKGLCCTNRLLIGLLLSPGRLVRRSLSQVWQVRRSRSGRRHEPGTERPGYRSPVRSAGSRTVSHCAAWSLHGFGRDSRSSVATGSGRFASMSDGPHCAQRRPWFPQLDVLARRLDRGGPTDGDGTLALAGVPFAIACQFDAVVVDHQMQRTVKIAIGAADPAYLSALLRKSWWDRTRSPEYPGA